MTKNEKREHGDVLYQAILTLKDLDECKKFFSDLCTVAELRAMEQRFEVAMLLSEGMIYNDILERTGASSATISRVTAPCSTARTAIRLSCPGSRRCRAKMAYEYLAQCYDQFTEDVDYERWADYVERHFARSRLPIHTVLDLACGTGSLTRLLALRGYEMIGADLSEEMLAQAAEKCRGVGDPEPIFLHQAMEELDLYGTIDACVCCLDSVNYVTRSGKLARAFQRVHTFLMPGGLFLFDINTPDKLRGLDGQMFLDETEDAYWRLAGGVCSPPPDLHLRHGYLPADGRRSVAALGGSPRRICLRAGGAGADAPPGRLPADQAIWRTAHARPPGR